MADDHNPKRQKTLFSWFKSDIPETIRKNRANQPSSSPLASPEHLNNVKNKNDKQCGIRKSSTTTNPVQAQEGTSKLNPAEEKRLEEVRQGFARWVCNERVSPVLLLNKHGAFKRYLDTVNPGSHSKLDAKSFLQDCLKIYKEQSEKVKEVFSKLDGRISISVDSTLLEKSWVSYEYHFCISAHFIDNDWELKKWVIKYCHDEFGIIDTVLEALRNWDLEGKILSLTGDSDTGNSVKEDIKERRELLLNGQLFHVQCSCDIICQMAQSAFEMIDNIIEKVKLLSWSKSEPIWYLTTSKLKSALELEALGEFSPENISDFYDVPSEEEWEKVRSIVKITDRIYDITKPLYEAKKQTANLFLPHLTEIHFYLAQESMSSDQFTKSVAEKMLETYTTYWNDMYLMLSIAAFMDPRYRMKLIEFSSSRLRCEEKAAHVLETIRELYHSYAVQNNEKVYVLSDSNSELEDEEEEDEKEEDTKTVKEKQTGNVMELMDLLKEYCSVKSEDDLSAKSDLDMYMEEPVLPWNENFSVLHWWKDNSLKYPKLSKMARDFLAVPMSLGISYEAYYTVPKPADNTMAGLGNKLMNALMCTRSWKFEYDGNK